MKKLTDEVRQAFQSEDEITFNAVSSLPYLKACIEEGLRLYPPTPGGLPRTVPEGGATVCGTYVPEKVCLLC
jgi:cytochrome P450